MAEVSASARPLTLICAALGLDWEWPGGLGTHAGRSRPSLNKFAHGKGKTMKKTLAWLASALWLTATPVFAHQDTPGLMGDHDMSGTVSKLDHKKGTFDLATGMGTLHLH